MARLAAIGLCATVACWALPVSAQQSPCAPADVTSSTRVNTASDRAGAVWVGAGKRRTVVMVDRGESCVRGDLPSKPALRATLRKGAKPSEVYVVPVDSRPGNELHVVAVRSAGAFVTAAPVLACSQGVDVAKVRAFPGQDSLVVTCRSGTGGHDYDATTTMWHPRTDVLHPVLTFWKGVRAEIVEQPGCHHAPRGSLSVVNAGAEPVLRTVAPLLDKEGAFTGRSATIRWSWRADKWRFEGSQPRLGPALEAIKVCGRK